MMTMQSQCKLVISHSALHASSGCVNESLSSLLVHDAHNDARVYNQSKNTPYSCVQLIPYKSNFASQY